MGIRREAGRRLDLHTKVLPELKVGDCVQLQNLLGNNPLKSDRAGIIWVLKLFCEKIWFHIGHKKKQGFIKENLPQECPWIPV